MARGLIPVPPSSTRALRIYAFDPLAYSLDTHDGHAGDNCIVAQVPFERLQPGPVGERVEVIDFDPACNTFYSPVDLEDRHLLAQDGLAPSESDPRFHQQMVYAVVMGTLARFEFALGRRLSWGTPNRRLRIYPHGTGDINAYFDADLGALIFGYFRASRSRSGTTLPGGYVFTCLSHAVVVHEATHAFVHSLRDKFMEPSSADTPAFHEAFADIVAIFQHFTMPGVVENAIQLTQARLDDISPLVSLGKQFSDAIGIRGTLRSQLNEKPDPRALLRTFEPHERGAILVAAVFDALVKVYRRRSKDLLRIATGGTGVLPKGDVSPDLVRRLAAEVRKTSKHFLNICIRALDYCPPVDIEFGEFLRAAVTADRDLAPEDPWGYRALLIESFRERGIYPKGAFSLAEASVVWEPFEERVDMSGIAWSRIGFSNEAQTPAALRRYRALLNQLVNRRRNMLAFRLDPSRPARVSSVQPLRRIGPDRRIHNEIVVEVLQTGPPITRYPGAPPFRSGATIIIAEPGSVRYVIYKLFEGKGRLERQRFYLEYLASTAPAHAYTRPMLGMSFARIHQGL